MPVNEENMRKWVAALRSGNYKQGRGDLRKRPINESGFVFCCLGVLCDISGLGEWDGTCYLVNGDPYEGDLPVPVAEWLGLVPVGSDKYGTDVELEDSTAINLNDNYGYTFEQIADAIERTYLS